MFGCNNPQTAVNPSGPQKQINEKQLKLMKEKCEGRESCTAEACNSWWNTNINCPSHEPAVMWLHYHCNGVPGGGKLDTKPDGGSCEAGSTPPTSVVTTPVITTPVTSSPVTSTQPDIIKKDNPISPVLYKDSIKIVVLFYLVHKI